MSFVKYPSHLFMWSARTDSLYDVQTLLKSASPRQIVTLSHNLQKLPHLFLSTLYTFLSLLSKTLLLDSKSNAHIKIPNTQPHIHLRRSSRSHRKRTNIPRFLCITRAITRMSKVFFFFIIPGASNPDSDDISVAKTSNPIAWLSQNISIKYCPERGRPSE